MIADIALALSIFNLLIWVVVIIAIKKLFKKLLPMFQMMGIAPTQNLQNSPVFDIIGTPPKLADAESEEH